MSAMREENRAPKSSAQGLALVLWVLWLTYGSFYFCRTNISAALKGIEGELGYTKVELGAVLAGLKLAYGIGQLVNGQLAERFSPRRLLAIGMLCSAALNVVFGFLTAFYFLLFVWACNGYVQALGWTPTMRVAANWLPRSARGTTIGIIGTGYQVTAALTFVVAGFSAQWFGWRGAMYVPAALLAASCLHMLLFLREAPPAAAGARTARPDTPHRAAHSFARTIRITLTNPALWLIAIGLGLLNASRYGFIDWGITHLIEVQGSGLGKAGIKYAVLPLGGVVGALLAGWITDRFFGTRRAPVICILLIALGLLAIAYNTVVHQGVALTVTVLVLVGFCIYGAQVLLVGTAPIDLARHGAPAAAVGFVNFMGYMGAFSGDLVTGALVDRHGWRAGILFWAGCAFSAAASVGLLWNARAGSPGEDQEP